MTFFSQKSVKNGIFELKIDEKIHKNSQKNGGKN